MCWDSVHWSHECLNFAISKHNCTVTLGLGAIMKLLHHFAILSTPSGASIWCSFSLLNSL